MFLRKQSSQADTVLRKRILLLFILKMGLVVGFIGVSFILLNIWDATETNQSVRMWTVLVLGLIAGLILGWFLPKLERLGLAVSGAALGFFIGLILYGFLLFKISSEPAFLIFYQICLICTLLGFIFGYEYH